MLGGPLWHAIRGGGPLWHAICGVALALVYHQYTSGQSALQLSHLSAFEEAWALERTKPYGQLGWLGPSVRNRDARRLAADTSQRV